jgi:hypothetical protein
VLALFDGEKCGLPQAVLEVLADHPCCILAGKDQRNKNHPHEEEVCRIGGLTSAHKVARYVAANDITCANHAFILRWHFRLLCNRLQASRTINSASSPARSSPQVQTLTPGRTNRPPAARFIFLISRGLIRLQPEANITHAANFLLQKRKCPLP